MHSPAPPPTEPPAPPPAASPRATLLWRRAAAYLLDIALLFALLAPLAFLVKQLTGFAPETPAATWRLQLLEFSLPSWCYFAIADASARGATLGKRLLGLRVVTAAGQRLAPGRAFARTALKLLPWELSHLSAFALGDRFGELTALQSSGLVVANLLALTWLLLALASRGATSAHDRLVATRVERVGRSLSDATR
ncbi:MAG: RDD family protein [Planctomycetes bacterium]|nr:RDD family protein [Planctomycetota bacterium]